MDITYYIIGATILSVTGAVMSARQTSAFEEERQRSLGNELKQNELKALDEENQRLEELRMADSTINATAGGVDPYGSPSLIALKKYNLKKAQQDIAATQVNRDFTRASLRSQILLSKRRARSARFQAIFQVGDSVLRGASAYNAAKE